MSADLTQLQFGKKEPLSETELQGQLYIYVQHEQHRLTRWLVAEARGEFIPLLLEFEPPLRTAQRSERPLVTCRKLFLLLWECTSCALRAMPRAAAASGSSSARGGSTGSR